MEEPSVSVATSADLRMAPSASPTVIRSTMSTPKSPSESSDDCEAPEYKCAICLGRLRNKSLIDSCFHEFCFECLVEWSKVKPECPLCKTKFEYIIHNVKSNDDYEKYHCQSNQPEHDLQIPWMEDPNRSFRYRTTMTPQLQERLAVQQIVAFRERNTANAGRARSRWSQRIAQNVPDFRSRVYRDNLWVQPLSDVTNRFRECSPSFYRENPAQVYRLVRWLQRELLVLLPLNCPHRTFVMQTIINNVFQHPIRSPFFATQLQPYLVANTRHFIHEFAEYARSPYDMGGHDRAATYLPHGPAAIEEVVLNSPTISNFSEDNLEDLLNSSGSDVEIIESSAGPPPAPVAGPSGVRRPRAPRVRMNKHPILPLSNEETHEIISSSSSDECEVIGTFKPPTPEIIDIISSGDESPSHSSPPRGNEEQQQQPREMFVNQIEETVDLQLERTPNVNSPSFLDLSTDRPRLIMKIESSRLNRKGKKRRRRRDSSSSWGRSSSESAERADHQNSKSRWDWSDSGSEYDPEGERRGRILSVVVPQPSFKAEQSSSRVVEIEGAGNGTEIGVAKREDGEQGQERHRKKKKSKHSRKHKKSHRAEDEDWGEGTSGSGGSRRCKKCWHKHCRCNRVAWDRCFKRIKNHHRETTTEERESASGSSRSRSKSKRYSKFKYSDSRCSDSSG